MKKQYIFGTNINNTGMSGIVELESRKIIRICDKENSEILLDALNNVNNLDETEWIKIGKDNYPTDYSKEVEFSVIENSKIMYIWFGRNTAMRDQNLKPVNPTHWRYVN